MVQDKPFVDVAAVIPLEEELQAFFDIFPSIKNVSDADTLLHEVKLPSTDISMVAIHQSDMGHAEAGQAVLEVLSRYRVGLFVCIGIAGGLSRDLRLGDVCYSGRVIDVYENSKAIDSIDDPTGKAMDVELSPMPYDTESRITRALNFARTQPDVAQLYSDWVSQQESYASATCPQKVPMREGPKEQLGKPKSLNGSIVCGMVSKSKNYNHRLKGLDRRALAIDTESGAVFRHASKNSVQALSVRGISDFADLQKTKLESETGGAVRRVAARSAVTFLSMQLQNPYFLRQLLNLRPGGQPSLTLSGHHAVTESIQDPLEEISQHIDVQLREFSPEYRLQPKGYKVPTPRIRRHSFEHSDITQEYSAPSELTEVLKSNKRLLIPIPRSYPDKSLPWVFAHDLLDAEIDGKQIVPIVVSGLQLSPPSRGLSRLSYTELDRIIAEAGFQVVFIIDSIPFHSPQRMKYMHQEVANYDSARFLFLTSSSPSLVDEHDIELSLSLQTYNLCDVSFREIAVFLQRSFPMSGSQADVVAKRLWDTFHAFDLSAHPTYFAGIPRETLMALLHAHRRVELLQLAVDGFVTLVVAEDESDVALSRTTRSRYLGNLVVDLHLEMKSYSTQELIASVETFAKEQDFDIDAIAFIRAFERKGILHFEDDRVAFSLPFIETYLLARRLAECDQLAQRYFDLDTKAFNFQVFDLYAEMGAHEPIKAGVVEQVERSISALKPLTGESHILLTGELNPRWGASGAHVAKLRKRLKRAASNFESGKSDTEEKQRILDLKDRISQGRAEHARAAVTETHREEVPKLYDAVRSFHVGVMLLGSGAETLRATEKRDLAGKLVELAAEIVDVWTRRMSDFEFNKFRQECLSESFLDECESWGTGKTNREELRDIIKELVDLLEGAVLAMPLRQMLSLLCEEARASVLAKSLEFVRTDSLMGGLVHAAWLADVDAGKGKRVLTDRTKSLPKARFLRVIMATHCLSRAFWSHWDRKEQLALLDLANGFLRPLSVSIERSVMVKKLDEKREEA